MERSVVYKKIVMFGDLNPAKALYGGKMMSWVDEAASIFAFEQLGQKKRFVTLKISEVLFKHPARLGDLLTFSANLSAAGRTSFGVSVSVHNGIRDIVTCGVTFVCVNDRGNPVPHGLRIE